MAARSLVGLYADPDGVARLFWRGEGERTTQEEVLPLEPFAWAPQLPPAGEYRAVELQGPGVYRYRLEFTRLATFTAALRERDWGLDAVRPLENQVLLQQGLRMFGDLSFAHLRRCQLAIETAATGESGVSDAALPDDRVRAIGLRFSDEPQVRVLTLPEDSDAAERELLKSFGALLQEKDPDIVEGHGIFNGTLDYLNRRCRRYRVARGWGRFGHEAAFRPAKLRVAERWIDYVRCDLPGRTVFDTFLAAQIYDVSTRDLSSYELDDVAEYFGVTTDDQVRPVNAGVEARLQDRLREISGVADLLLPTYVAQAQNFPMILQEVCLRGTGNKIDLLLLEKYHQAGHALPDYPEVQGFEGAFTRSFHTGVFRQVLHFDVASLYPSLLLRMERNPVGDTLGIFMPLLRELREYRLRFKKLAQETTDPALRSEYTARQNSFKILINSFYGYLGFAGARFADSDLAAEVTRQGRELLQSLIAGFERLGCPVLEADTDGLYVAAPAYYEAPERLLAAVSPLLPEGLSLEYDGAFPVMFCYKAKNYALYDGEKVLLKGSALRSRATEPFLRELGDHLVRYLLGLDAEHPRETVARLEQQLNEGTMPLEKLLKGEYLSMSPAAYARKMQEGGKPRRAALEVALRLQPPPRMGDKVYYYIRPREKGQTSDWQRAASPAEYHPTVAPYDPGYYLKKLQEWQTRYGEFLELP